MSAWVNYTLSDFRGGLNTSLNPWELSPQGQGPTPPDQHPSLDYSAAKYLGGAMQFPQISNLLLWSQGKMVARGGQHEMIPSQASTPHGFYQFRNTSTTRLMLSVGQYVYAWTTNPAINSDYIAPPAAPATSAAGAAGLLSGTYTYWYTFVDTEGAESYLSPGSTPITVASKQVNLTHVLVSGNVNVVARNIYRSSSNALDLPISFVGTIANNTTAAFTDNTADVDLRLSAQYSLASGQGTPAGTPFPVNFGGPFFDTTTETQFQSAYSNVFIMDGVNTPQKWDGTEPRVYRMGIVPPGTAPVTTGTPDYGNLWGTSSIGGSGGLGSIWSATLAGVPTLRNSFTSTSTGSGPLGGVVEGVAGNVYGATEFGGANNFGAIYSFDQTNSIRTLLYEFSVAGTTDGHYPLAQLLVGADGKLYGTCSSGGASSDGTIFQFDPATATFVLLHSFDNANHDRLPTGRLVQPPDGFLYGTTDGAGGGGNFYKCSTAGAYTSLFDFNATTATNGADPVGGLCFNSADGLFYGTCSTGGSHGKGTLWKFTSAGAITLLHTFGSGGTDGDTPVGALTIALDGKLYGMTSLGGTGDGVVYSTTTAGTYATVYSFATVVVGGETSFFCHPVSGVLYASSGGAFFSVTTLGVYTLLHALELATGVGDDTNLIPGPGALNSNDQLPGASGLSPYQYYVTFVNYQGTESNPSPISTGLVVTFQAVALSAIPTSTDPQVVSRNIYRVGGTSTVARLVGTIADNTTTTFTDNIADIDLSLTVLSFTHDVPPDGARYMFYNNNRMYLWGHPDFPYRLYFSSFQFPEYYPTVIEDAQVDGGFFDISSSNGDKIVGLGQTGSAIIVLNQYTAYTLLGSSLSQDGSGFSDPPIAGARGCLARKSIVNGCGPEDECVYLADDGQIYAIGGGGYRLISKDVENTLRSISVADLSGAYAAYVDLGYHIFIPLASGGITALRYDYREKSWVGISDPELLGTIATTTPGNTGVGGELWFSTASGYDFAGTPYNGIVSALSIDDTSSEIPIDWLSPEFEYGQKSFTNTARRVRIEGNVEFWDDTAPARLSVRAITPDNPDVFHTYKMRPRGNVLIDTRVHQDLNGQRLQFGIFGNVKTITVQSVMLWYSPDIREVVLR